MPGSPPLASLHDLRMRFRDAPRPALDGVSLNIQPGEVFGIVGRSGAGKSASARWVNMPERPDPGRVLVNGEDLTRLDGPALWAARRRVGMLFQHFNLLSGRTVAAKVARPPEIARVPALERAARVTELPPLVGMADRAGAHADWMAGLGLAVEKLAA